MPLTYFRAAAVIGAGSESFRVVFYLVKRLPAMVTPRWVSTKTQPIAIADVIAYLRAAPEIEAAAGREIEIGGPEATTYGGMMEEMARALGRRPPLQIPVPLLTPQLSSLWIGLVTPVDVGVARPLIEGLATETIVADRSGMELFEVEPTPLDAGDARSARRAGRLARPRVALGEGPGALLLDRAGLVELEAQGVDHRARQQREADEVEPEQGDEDEAERAAELVDRSTGRGRTGRSRSRSPWSRSRTAPRARPRATARGPSGRRSRSARRRANVSTSAAAQARRRCAPRRPRRGRTAGCRRSRRARPRRPGSTTLAARKRMTTTSITSAKRFCSTQPRHSTW